MPSKSLVAFSESSCGFCVIWSRLATSAFMSVPASVAASTVSDSLTCPPISQVSKYAVISLYKRGTPAAAVVDAVFRDGSSKAAEVALRRMNSRDAEKLQVITEKVGGHSQIGLTLLNVRPSRGR
ncbi:hypothetical protein [Streptomyces anulatus]|uniref:hypothetical protein n=1 Tax=Streptomyces anulatus TaxID=1892 RepID=UPI001C275EEA|nr:hypothetical protein [Streptomyces anulatus]